MKRGKQTDCKKLRTEILPHLTNIVDNKKINKEISFTDIFDMNEVQRLQDFFAKATGVACQILSPDGKFITGRSNYCHLCGDIIRENPKGLKRCNESDISLSKLTPDVINIYHCRSAGLLEAGARICVGGRHIATWGLGQVNDGTQTEEGIRAYARELDVDEDEMADAFNKVTVMSRERFEDVARMMHAITNQLAEIAYQNIQKTQLIDKYEKTKNELSQFEWLQEKESDMPSSHYSEYTPPYSDVTELNTERTILDSIGKDLLASMAKDLMDLLDTSVAVYEKNGDYAYGLFTSSWCRLFDSAAFKLCNTGDTGKALNSGKWLCHECCWNESAKTAIESGMPTDIECIGGIRLYAVPIKINDEIVGVINIGYGNSPTDENKIRELANLFGIDEREVRNAALEYKPRPEYIINVAKHRCKSVANHIAEIIQRKRTQQTLEKNERRLQTLMDNLPGMAYRCPNKDGWPITFVSKGCRKITGYSPEELGGQAAPSFTDWIHPDDIQRVKESVKKSIYNKESFVMEYRLIDREGKEHWVLEHGRATGQAPDGNAILEGFISDITERKEAEKELARERERLDYILDASRLGTWTWNIKENTAEFNEMWANQLGYTMEELGPSSYELWKSLGHPEDVPEIEKLLQKCATGETQDYRSEFRMRHKDGHWGWILDRGRVMTYDADGQPLEMFGTHTDISDLKHAEEELAKQRDMFELVINSAPINIFWKDVNSIYLGCNTVFAQANGAENPYQIIGKNDFDLIWGAEAQKYIDDDQQVIKSGMPKLRYDETYILPDGSTEWWRTSKIPLKNKAGETIGVLALSEVVTRQKEAEDALKAALDRLSVAVAGGGLGTWEWLVQTGETTLDDRWQTMLGYEPGEIGLRLECAHALTDPEALPNLNKTMQEHLDGKTPFYEAVYRMHHKSGKWVWIHDRGEVTERDKDGAPIRVCGTHADITPLMQTQEELRQSESKFRGYIERAPFGIFITDSKGNYIDVNPAASEITGYTRDELLTMEVKSMIPTDHLEKAQEHFINVVEKGYSDGILPFIRKEGTTKLWNVTAVRLNSEQILGFVQDVTEREQMEEQLRKAQKLDAVGQLAGGVAHDFNNLLMSIIGYTELCIDETEENSQIHEWLEEIINETQRSTNIVRQLLAFSRKQTISPQILNINDAVEQVLKMLRRLLGENIDLMWMPCNKLCSIEIDPSQLDQILMNLCINARDAISDIGKITIETAQIDLDTEYCAVHAEASPGSFTVLAISDSGCGMSEQTKSSIFEPFFTTKTEGKGTGLGLATVYGVVKQNNGFINVYSEPGKGTTFRIYFPCVKKEAENTNQTETKIEGSKGNETVMIVEDEKSIREITTKMLKQLGYSVLSAESPEIAIDIAEKHKGKIDLLLTDVIMPGMNGRQLAEKILEERPEMDIIYMSGYTANVIAHQGILDKDVNFLPKPINRNQLARKIRDILDSRNTGRKFMMSHN